MPYHIMPYHTHTLYHTYHTTYHATPCIPYHIIPYYTSHPNRPVLSRPKPGFRHPIHVRWRFPIGSHECDTTGIDLRVAGAPGKDGRVRLTFAAGARHRHRDKSISLSALTLLHPTTRCVLRPWTHQTVQQEGTESNGYRGTVGGYISVPPGPRSGGPEHGSKTVGSIAI